MAVEEGGGKAVSEREYCQCCGYFIDTCSCTYDGARNNGFECFTCRPISKWFGAMTPQQKQDDADLFGKEDRFLALLRIAKELQTCCDNMGLKPGQDDPEMVARARSASVQLNQFISGEKI